MVLVFYKLLNEHRTIRTPDACFWACSRPTTLPRIPGSAPSRSRVATSHALQRRADCTPFISARRRSGGAQQRRHGAPIAAGKTVREPNGIYQTLPRPVHTLVSGSPLPRRHRLPADRGGHLPVLPPAAPRHLAVAKDMHPATPGILRAAQVLQTFPARGMRHHRIREMAPGAYPFGICTRQPAGAYRMLVFHRMWCHGQPPRSAYRSTCGSMTACARARWTYCEGVATGTPWTPLRAIPDGSIVRPRRQRRVGRCTGGLLRWSHGLRHQEGRWERLPPRHWVRCQGQEPHRQGEQARHPDAREEAPPGLAMEMAQFPLEHLRLDFHRPPCRLEGLDVVPPGAQTVLSRRLRGVPPLQQALGQRHGVRRHLKQLTDQGITVGLHRTLESLEGVFQPGEFAIGTERGSAIVRHRDRVMGFHVVSHTLLLRTNILPVVRLAFLWFVVRVCGLCSVRLLPAHPRHRQWLQTTALRAGLRLPPAPLREFRLRLFPAHARPCRILELDAQERLAAPPSLPQ